MCGTTGKPKKRAKTESRTHQNPAYPFRLPLRKSTKRRGAPLARPGCKRDQGTRERHAVRFVCIHDAVASLGGFACRCPYLSQNTSRRTMRDAYTFAAGAELHAGIRIPAEFTPRHAPVQKTHVAMRHHTHRPRPAIGWIGPRTLEIPKRHALRHPTLRATPIRAGRGSEYHGPKGRG